MNRYTTTERYHDPLIMLTRCRQEDLDREVARSSQLRMVRAERTSHATTAFHRLAHAWWQALRARTTRAIGGRSVPAATTK